jgi:hypothetical protein
MYDVTDIVSYISPSEGQNNTEWALRNVARKFGFDISAKLLPLRRLLTATSCHLDPAGETIDNGHQSSAPFALARGAPMTHI